MEKEQAPKSVMRPILNFIYIVVFLMVLAGIWLGPVTGPYGGGHVMATPSAAMGMSRQIGLCLHQYSIDHGGHYPEGKTSTEIFQQLIDQKYVTDPELFYLGYFGISGKVRPQNDHLNAENVCFDVTCCVDSSSPDDLPVVFLTGFKINYQAGAKAVPVGKPEPAVKRTWSQWWNGTPDSPRNGIAVSNKDTSARWIRADEDGSIPNFIPADFDPKGKTYRQLTP